MSTKYPGGVIKSSPVVPAGPYQNSSASGVWTMEQAGYWIKQGNWPTAGNFNNRLYSWGLNTNGQLGLGNTTQYNSPKQVGTLTTWSSISSGNFHTIATKTDGTLWSWGYNARGQLGLGNTTYFSSPKQVGALTTWSKIAGGTYESTIAIKTDGTLWSWGRNDVGQLGLGNTTERSSPVQVGALTTWSKISAGSNFSLATKTDGTLWSWGANGNGALGLGNLTNYSSPKQVGSLTTWSKINCGDYHTIATKTDGTLWSWGYNMYGQLGLGDTANRSSPVQVGALTTWLNIAGGKYQTLAVKTNGTLWSWGRGTTYGQLGLGNTTNYSSPKQVGALTTWLSIACGSYFSLATKTDGTLWSWGSNNNGQLGLGNITNHSSPVQVGALTTWSKLSTGGNNTIAIQS
jgi:alpha-tubulin suppressor-like RCC1 family protein